MTGTKKAEKVSKTPGQHKGTYVYYTLCRKCQVVNVPDPPGLCSCCARKTAPHDNYRPQKNADYRTKRDAGKSGALPWVYRTRRDDREMCHLKYGNWEISVQRQENRKFCYIVGCKEFSVFRRNITELVFARTRSVRHLARILNMTFDELYSKIIESTPKSFYKK